MPGAALGAAAGASCGICAPCLYNTTLSHFSLYFRSPAAPARLPPVDQSKSQHNRCLSVGAFRSPSAVNSMLGYLHRLVFASEHLAGAKLRQNEAGGVNSCSTFTGSVLPSVATDFIIFTSCLTTFLASWICYRELFCSAFRWFMVLSVNKQLSAALAMDSAMARGLPCYLNCVIRQLCMVLCSRISETLW